MHNTENHIFNQQGQPAQVAPFFVIESVIRFIDMFSGIGGFREGLTRAGGFECVGHCEIDKYANRSYNALFDTEGEWFVDDARKADPGAMPNFQLICGGFPCQAFSFAGKKLGFEDTRGTLFHEFARCVKEVNPKIFMAENVRGLVSHDKGRTLTTIINVLEALGYHTQQKILNAAYFGVGQKRERIVIVGIRNDTDIEFSYPNEEDKMTTLREALKGCPKSDGVEYSEKKKKVLALVPPGGCWVDLPEDIAKEYMGKSYYSGGGRRGMARRISWEEPCLTLTCSPSQKQTERCHPEETRPFTVRESARIQSFPDDWTFCGGIGDQYKQIGNAVPVEMARRIGIQLKEAVLSEQKG